MIRKIAICDDDSDIAEEIRELLAFLSPVRE